MNLGESLNHVYFATSSIPAVVHILIHSVNLVLRPK